MNIFYIACRFNQFIQPVCLWESSLDMSPAAYDKLSFIAGWGADERGFQVTNIPKMVSAKIFKNIECLAFPGANKIVTPRTLCAGNVDGSGPCVGDSGAGLVITYEQRWILRAIVSGGLKSSRLCDKQDFVVYCDLAKHIDWVRSNLID